MEIFIVYYYSSDFTELFIVHKYHLFCYNVHKFDL